MVSKSANYCFATSANPDGVLLLSEVALGTPYEKLRAEYEADASCRRAGKGHTWEGEDGARPGGRAHAAGRRRAQGADGQGKPTDQDGSSLLYNEFIVYDTSRSSRSTCSASVQVPAALLSGRRAARREEAGRDTLREGARGEMARTRRGGRIQ